METDIILSNEEFTQTMKSVYNLDVFEINSTMYYLNTDKLVIKILNIVSNHDELLASLALKRAHEITLGELFKIEYSIIIYQNIQILPITKTILDEANIKIFTSYLDANNWILL